ncbi:MAG: hypothetical protein ACE5EC_03025, partial [Phycisphaerae bacterium]
MNPPPIKYIAQLNNVRELALYGTADLSWWQDHLAGEELEPVEVDGRAQVAVTGLDTKWMGIPFRDLSVAVAARLRSGSAEPGFFLARAFNTSRFIAGVERRWFHLPYRFRSDLQVEIGTSSLLHLGHSPTVDLSFELGSREPSGQPPQEMGFTGPLFLPKGRDATRRRWFGVRIVGLTTTYDFDDGRDRFEIAPACADPILAGLRESQFKPIQWHHRPGATHARS